MKKQNYVFWRDFGFLAFEARAFSKETRQVKGKRAIKVDPVPFNVPYVQAMIKQRAKLHDDFMKRGGTEKDYKKMILKLYRKDGRIKNGKPDAWKTLRDWEQRSKQDYPDYESPGGKKPRKSRGTFNQKMKRG